MIPAILAAPMVEGVVGSVAGSVIGGVQSLFSQPPPPPRSRLPSIPTSNGPAQAAAHARRPTPRPAAR